MRAPREDPLNKQERRDQNIDAKAVAEATVEGVQGEKGEFEGEQE